MMPLVLGSGQALCVVSGRLASTIRLSGWCAPTAGSSFCWTRLTWPWLSECQPPPLSRTGEAASSTGMALAGGRSRHPCVPLRACGLLREAGEWTVTDQLTHVSPGDLGPSGLVERKGAGVSSSEPGRSKSQAVVLGVPGTVDMRSTRDEVISVLTGIVKPYWPTLSESKALWTLGMVRPFLGTVQRCRPLTSSSPTAVLTPASSALVSVSPLGPGRSGQSPVH